ncbi:hypothetical protein DYH10_03280 [Candidatus Saccharibacteria bacterium CPR2]|nr:hypothetical protein [Candidatus Saccharibacteria bacterium CPR2]
MDYLKNSTKRVANDLVGFTLLVIGLILSLPGLPGPGLLVILLGLGLLARNYPWAKKPLETAKKYYEKAKAKLIKHSGEESKRKH